MLTGSIQIGSYHTSELAFTLGAVWIWSKENAAAYNHSKFNPQPGYDYERTETDRKMADFMSTLWTNFAKYGWFLWKNTRNDQNKQLKNNIELKNDYLNNRKL